MIRDLGRTITEAVMEGVGRATSQVQERRPLPVDLLESDEAFLAVFDAPGVGGSDVQVRFDENVVEVRIDRFREFHEDFEMRLPGRGLALDGRVTLPAEASVEPDEAAATLRTNGTLEVRVPKDDTTDDAVDDAETPADESVDTDADADADADDAGEP